MREDPAHARVLPYLSAWLRERIGSPGLGPGAVVSRLATVLHADLSGFTQLTARFTSGPADAERLHIALNQCYSVLIDTITAYGGDVAAIAGDALTAWWPQQADAEHARRCALALHAAMLSLPALETPAGPFRFYLRIGIGVGMVHATLAGMPGHGVHLVLAGPALAAVAAAEQAAPGESIICSIQTAPGAAQECDHPGDGGQPLRAEHFLPRGLSARLRRGEPLTAYRRCVPVFARFDLPAQPAALHPLVREVQQVVQRWGGWLNEIEVGDKGAVLVLLFGATVVRSDDASRAVGCSLALRERGLIERAGITLGLLYLGTVGGSQRRVYTAQGDEMNLAAHLMQRAAPGEILVSGRVRHEVLQRYPTSEPTLMVTKGHPEGVPVARVLGSQV